MSPNCRHVPVLRDRPLETVLTAIFLLVILSSTKHASSLSPRSRSR